MGAFPISVVERIGNVVAASVFGMRFDGHLATLNKHRVVLLGGWLYRCGDVCGVSEACEILVRLSVYRIAVAQAFAA